MALINQGGKLLLQNGALASGSGCCCGGSPCECALPYPAGTVVTANFTITLKDGMTSCAPGEYVKQIMMTWNGFDYRGTGTIGGLANNILAVLYCFGNQMYFFGVVNTCNFCVWDAPGNNQTCGMACEVIFDGISYDGRCEPPRSTAVANAPEDPPQSDDPATYGLNFSVSLSVQ